MYAKMWHVAPTGVRENSRDSHVKKREPAPVSGSEVGSDWRPWFSFVLVNLTYARGLIWRTDADELTPRGISCRVVLSAKTTESAAVWLQQLKYNNGAADKILWLLVKEPTADVRRFLHQQEQWPKEIQTVGSRSRARKVCFNQIEAWYQF